MSAQGFDRCTYYQRLEDSFDARAAFIFEGIGATELLGDFGIIGGGAAGSEIDFYNPSLGSPPDTLVLATSGPLSDTYLLVAEELYEQLPGSGRDGAAVGPLGRRLRGPRRRRRLLLGRFDRVDRVALTQRIRQQHRPFDHERVAAIPRRRAAQVGHRSTQDHPHTEEATPWRSTRSSTTMPSSTPRPASGWRRSLRHRRPTSTPRSTPAASACETWGRTHEPGRARRAAPASGRAPW